MKLYFIGGGSGKTAIGVWAKLKIIGTNIQEFF